LDGIIDTHFLVQKNDGSVLMNFTRAKLMPNMAWYDEGLAFRATPEPVRIGGHGPAVGFFGLAAGPGKTIIDFEGLTDPLLSHLPPAAATSWGPGHFERHLPAGYEASVRAGENLLEEPDVHAYYDLIRAATRGRLGDKSRWSAIWNLNTETGRALLRSYAQRHPPQ